MRPKVDAAVHLHELTADGAPVGVRAVLLRRRPDRHARARPTTRRPTPSSTPWPPGGGPRAAPATSLAWGLWAEPAGWPARSTTRRPGPAGPDRHAAAVRPSWAWSCSTRRCGWTAALLAPTRSTSRRCARRPSAGAAAAVLRGLVRRRPRPGEHAGRASLAQQLAAAGRRRAARLVLDWCRPRSPPCSATPARGDRPDRGLQGPGLRLPGRRRAAQPADRGHRAAAAHHAGLRPPDAGRDRAAAAARARHRRTRAGRRGNAVRRRRHPRRAAAAGPCHRLDRRCRAAADRGLPVPARGGRSGRSRSGRRVRRQVRRPAGLRSGAGQAGVRAVVRGGVQPAPVHAVRGRFRRPAGRLRVRAARFPGRRARAGLLGRRDRRFGRLRPARRGRRAVRAGRLLHRWRDRALAGRPVRGRGAAAVRPGDDRHADAGDRSPVPGGFLGRDDRDLRPGGGTRGHRGRRLAGHGHLHAAAGRAPADPGGGPQPPDPGRAPARGHRPGALARPGTCAPTGPSSPPTISG